MEFDPNNNVIQLCVQGMDMEANGKSEEAGRLFLKAWNEATNEFEKYTAAYYVARHQTSVRDKLKWLEIALRSATKINDVTVRSAFPTLYSELAQCYDDLGDLDNAKKAREKAVLSKDEISDPGPFYHGTKADLQVGDLLTPGGSSNYKPGLIMNHIYFTALVNGAGLAAALAKGEGRERVYIVEPTGTYENDPNVTDKKFPGNPTRSYRTSAPLKIVGEVADWVRQSPEDLKRWRERLANNNGAIIN